MKLPIYRIEPREFTANPLIKRVTFRVSGAASCLRRVTDMKRTATTTASDHQATIAMLSAEVGAESELWAVDEFDGLGRVFDTGET